MTTEIIEYIAFFVIRLIIDSILLFYLLKFTRKHHNLKLSWKIIVLVSILPFISTSPIGTGGEAFYENILDFSFRNLGFDPVTFLTGSPSYYQNGAVELAYNSLKLFYLITPIFLVFSTIFLSFRNLISKKGNLLIPSGIITIVIFIIFSLVSYIVSFIWLFSLLLTGQFY